MVFCWQIKKIQNKQQKGEISTPTHLECTSPEKKFHKFKHKLV